MVDVAYLKNTVWKMSSVSAVFFKYTMQMRLTVSAWVSMTRATSDSLRMLSPYGSTINDSGDTHDDIHGDAHYKQWYIHYHLWY